jgi:hypothetical protein
VRTNPISGCWPLKFQLETVITDMFGRTGSLLYMEGTLKSEFLLMYTLWSWNFSEKIDIHTLREQQALNFYMCVVKAGD